MHSNSLSLNYYFKAVAVVTAIALLLWSIGFPTWIRSADAGGLYTISDLLSDSDLFVGSDHTITFSNETAIGVGDNILLRFNNAFNTSTSTAVLELLDFDVATTGELILGTACGGGADWSVSTATANQILFTACNTVNAVVATSGTTTIEIGTLASTGGAGQNQIINPTTPQSYEIDINTTNDVGQARVAIIDDVLVSARVDTSLVFVIYGLEAGTNPNGTPTTTSASTTATEIPFGTLRVASSTTLAQSISVSTNATNGFTVTLNQNQNLTSSGGDDIDSFIDDAGTAVPTGWVSPGGTFGNENEYGHMGITTEDSDLSDGDSFGNDLWAGNFVNNPREVLYHTGPADGVTPDIGSTTIGFQAEITAFQEAGTDYEAYITYVATPIF